MTHLLNSNIHLQKRKIISILCILSEKEEGGNIFLFIFKAKKLETTTGQQYYKKNTDQK